MKYYSGVYMNDGKKVLQVSDDVDGLNCEILANPGVCVSQDISEYNITQVARDVARFMMYDYVELHTSNTYELYDLFTETVIETQ